jgi:hypothetical protein
MDTRIRNRERPSINLDGDWTQHTDAIPKGSFPLGTITLSGVEGALIQVGEGEAATYVMINSDGLFHRLSTRKVRMSLKIEREAAS